MKHSLKMKLSLTIALVVSLTVAVISVLSNFFIDKQFKEYISKQQAQQTKEIVSGLSQQYNLLTNMWNTNFVHTIGMYSLYDGYIIKVYDNQNQTIWDAEECDMTLCSQVMNDIHERMLSKYPQLNGKFTTKEFDLTQNGQTIGTVHIGYFGPYFLSENDFQFLDALNAILIGIGVLSLICSVIVGWYMAKRLSSPIHKTVEVAKQISDGHTTIRIEEETDITELHELIGSINHLADSLGKQESLRKQLTADVAHELRTPVTTVGTHLEAMIEGIWQPTPERLQSCHEEITRIGKLVLDLESLARVESDNLKLEKTQVNLLELATKAVRNFEAQISEKNLHVAIDGNCENILADPDRINQVLINLISNAIKYTPDSGVIRITISETDSSARFSIQDNGIGIPEDELAFIFERFYRADKSRNRLTGGSGIGLAIVKSIITAHGGSVRAESRLDEGAEFIVELGKNEL